MIDYLVFYHFGASATVHNMTVRAYTSDHAKSQVEDKQWDNCPVVDKVEVA
ncbi:hypothetical protein vBAspALolek_07 [Aeromonas phage vB_AspA_Lolek]|nr:hypothetical protein vBAspALolek_07 [Aeromonas phage vB_AspA_Lolek]